MITEKDFAFRCCWTCVHCELDILRGYECCAMPKIGPIPLGGNEEIHKDRENCKAYKTMNTTTKKHRGRPRIGEALRVSLTFSVDPEVRSMAQNLRNTGYPLNELIRLTICEAFEEQAQAVRDKEAGTL